MQVEKYLFQSPYTSSVQVGRLDPSSSQNQTASETSTQDFVKSKTEVKAQEVAQTQESKPSVNVSSEPTHLLDVTV